MTLVSAVDCLFSQYPECIVHPVSCTGVSRDPFSKKLKKAYPDYFREYSRLCIRHNFTHSQAYLYPLGVMFGTKFIVTLTIKKTWQEKLKPEIFRGAFQELLIHLSNEKISSVGFPFVDGVPPGWLEQEWEKQCTLPNSSLEKVFLLNQTEF